MDRDPQAFVRTDQVVITVHPSRRSPVGRDRLGKDQDFAHLVAIEQPAGQVTVFNVRRYVGYFTRPRISDGKFLPNNPLGVITIFGGYDK